MNNNEGTANITRERKPSKRSDHQSTFSIRIVSKVTGSQKIMPTARQACSRIEDDPTMHIITTRADSTHTWPFSLPPVLRIATVNLIRNMPSQSPPTAAAVALAVAKAPSDPSVSLAEISSPTKQPSPANASNMVLA